MKKVAFLLFAAGMVAACSESPTSPSGVRAQFSQDGDGPYITSAVNSGPNQVTATFAGTVGKSYNVHMSPTGGTRHITSAELVDNNGTAIFNSLPAGEYTVCVKEQGIGGPFGGCMQVTVGGEAITLLAQLIDFGPLDNKTYGDGTFTVSATGGASDSPITFIAAGNCTIEGNVVTITGAGSCMITANQDAAEGYTAAESVSQSFAIAPKALTIDASPSSASRTYGDANPTCAYSVSGTVGAENFAVSCDWNNATGVTPAGSVVANNYAVTCDNGCVLGNYSYTIPTTNLTITAKALAITVSPSTASRTYGQANPTCSYSVSGTVGTENFAVSCNWDSATATTAVGSVVANGYTVTCDNGCVLGNYAFTIPTANLTIVAYNCGVAHDFIQPVGSMPATKAPVKLGSVVPVKFVCVDTNNQPILNLTADFKAVNMSNQAVLRNVANAFRLSNVLTGQYLYNLDTTIGGFLLNGQYGLYAYLNDGSTIDGGIFMAAK
jgi:hypothetical protein